MSSRKAIPNKSLPRSEVLERILVKDFSLRFYLGMPLFLLLSLQDVAGDVHYVRRAVPWAMETIGLSARCWLCIYSVFAVIEYLCDLSWLGRKIVTLSLRLLGTHVREYKRKPSFPFVFRSLNRTFEAWRLQVTHVRKNKRKGIFFCFSLT